MAGWLGAWRGAWGGGARAALGPFLNGTRSRVKEFGFRVSGEGSFRRFGLFGRGLGFLGFRSLVPSILEGSSTQQVTSGFWAVALSEIRFMGCWVWGLEGVGFRVYGMFGLGF